MIREASRLRTGDTVRWCNPLLLKPDKSLPPRIEILEHVVTLQVDVFRPVVVLTNPDVISISF